MNVLRIGVLGAAAIAPAALLKPARRRDDVVVTAIAARDVERARAFAAQHHIPSVHDSYQAVLDDPDVDAVYIPLPNSLHAQWTLAAIEAGKHVLCEKPFTANAAEARRVADAAEASDLVVMEAFHYRYHPLTVLVRSLLDRDAIGTVRHIEAHVCLPLVRGSDIRYQFDLAGGAMMDAGCYAIHALRVFGGGEPKVIAAQATLRSPEVDRRMDAEFRFPDGAIGRVIASLWSRRFVDVSARIIGDDGEIRVMNFVAPHRFNRITVRARGRTRSTSVSGEASYDYQLRAFTDAVLRGEEILTPAADAVATMSVIDDVYRTAGLAPRGL